jgi:hypothetical protein
MNRLARQMARIRIAGEPGGRFGVALDAREIRLRVQGATRAPAGVAPDGVAPDGVAPDGVVHGSRAHLRSRCPLTSEGGASQSRDLGRPMLGRIPR